MTTRHLSRRGLFKAAATGAAASLASPYLAHHLARASAPAGTLKAVLESEVVILDPHFTTAAITRTFGYHVYDTLFAMDDSGQIRPQMVDQYASSAVHLSWTFQLRDGLRWHDGGPVTASDCVASLRRWAPRDAMGRLLMASMQSLDVKDAHTFELALSEPFPLVLEVLGNMIGCLEKARGVNVVGLGGLHMFQGNFRLNHAAPPFDDPAVRRVLWKLVDQASMLQAIGVPAR